MGGVGRGTIEDPEDLFFLNKLCCPIDLRFLFFVVAFSTSDVVGKFSLSASISSRKGLGKNKGDDGIPLRGLVKRCCSTVSSAVGISWNCSLWSASGSSISDTVGRPILVALVILETSLKRRLFLCDPPVDPFVERCVAWVGGCWLLVERALDKGLGVCSAFLLSGVLVEVTGVLLLVLETRLERCTGVAKAKPKSMLLTSLLPAPRCRIKSRSSREPAPRSRSNSRVVTFLAPAPRCRIRSLSSLASCAMLILCVDHIECCDFQKWHAPALVFTRCHFHASTSKVWSHQDGRHSHSGSVFHR